MRMVRKRLGWTLHWLLISLMVAPPWVLAQGSGDEKKFQQEELDQILAPIALHPDSLLVQILMASTYPLEVVQANRWAKQNKGLKGDALTTALEKQPWDPSVKSLMNFPEVLAMMSDKLDWMQNLGDAFLAQEKDVMNTVQKLRAKAQEAGNLKTTKEQTVIVEKETQTIVIQPADPQVVYVPTYNPTVVYGVWWYPAYPPYPVYPPGYVATTVAFSFVAGVAVGAAWGYAWGGCHWGHSEVDIDIDRNTNINHNINREKYKNEMPNRGQTGDGGRGKWQHDPSHRKGVAYRDQATGQKYNRGSSSNTVQSRESFRGRPEQGRQDPARVDTRESTGRGGRDNAIGEMDRGSNTRTESDRGRTSRESMSSRTRDQRSSSTRTRTGGGRR